MVSNEERKRLLDYIEKHLQCECTEEINCRRCLIDLVVSLKRIAELHRSKNGVVFHSVNREIKLVKGLEIEIGALALQNILVAIEDHSHHKQ